MPSDERYLLYASAPGDYALLAWPDAMDGPRLLAVPGAGNRSRLSHPEKAAHEIKSLGGLAVKVQPSGDALHIIAKGYLTGRYQPPDAILVLDSSDLIERRPLRPEGLFLKTSDFALIPVDLPSQHQLEAWLTGLDGLPGDLKLATLGSIRNSGVFEAIARPAEAPSTRRGLAWLWIALAALIGLSLGAAGGVWWARNPVPPQVRRQTPPPPPAISAHPDLSGPLRELEERMDKSGDPKIKELLKPLAAAKPQEKSTAEAWMLLKLALHTTVPEANLDNDAAGQYKEVKDGNEQLKKAVTVVACAAGAETAAQLLGSAQDCPKLTAADWDMAKDEIGNLPEGAPASKEPAKAPEPAATTKPTVKPTVKTTATKTRSGN